MQHKYDTDHEFICADMELYAKYIESYNIKKLKKHSDYVRSEYGQKNTYIESLSKTINILIIP